MANENGNSQASGMDGQPPKNGQAGANGSAGPAVHLKKEPTRQMVQQTIRNDRFPVIPHVSTYAGKYNYVNQNYNVYWDEALRDSQANSLSMRRDGLVDELIRHRVAPVVGLDSHFKVDDPDHPDQFGISETLNKIYLDIPYLKYMLRNLMEATFYGRYGSQIQLGPRTVGGNEWNSIKHHIPVNGDKFRYKWDGTPGIAIYSGSNSEKEFKDNEFLQKYHEFIETSPLGMALYLYTDHLRDRFVIHRFEPFDTDYLFEIDEAQSVFGLGMRSRLYWIWNLRTELLSWMVDALQRVGANGMLYAFYQSGNVQMQQEAINALLQLVKDNISAFPYMMGEGAKGAHEMIQRIEPSPVGYDVMLQLIQHLEGIMRRDFLGQDLSSESKPAGLGGGLANLHGDVRIDLIEYDAMNLAESLNSQLVKVLLKYNKFKYEGKVYKGSDLPFSIKLEFQVDRQQVQEKMAAAQGCYEMGIELDKDDIRKIGGFSPPRKKATALVNPQLEQLQQQNSAGVPGVEHLTGQLKGLVGAGKQAGQMGMMSGGVKPGGQQQRPQASRFAKAKPVSILAGRLYLSKSGWGLLSVPNDLVYGIFDAISTTGLDLPPNSDHGKQKLNAHISVFHPNEIEKLGGPNALVERGHYFHYNLGPIKQVKPAGWSEMKQVYFVEVESEELQDLRESYGLTRLPKNGKHQFHISVAVQPNGKQKERTARFAKAGDADDCGHDFNGPFSKGNTCAGEGGPSGEGYSFQSPNIKEDTKFDYAYSHLKSADQKAALLQADEIDKKLGMSSHQFSAIGDWADGAENSVISSYEKVPSYDHLVEAAALKGLKWNQKAVIPFMVNSSGSDYIHHIDISDHDVKKIRRKLDAAGLQFRSITPSAGQYRVTVFDPGGSLFKNLERFGRMYEGKIKGKSYKGKGEFIGAESRTEARKIYRDRIKQARRSRGEPSEVSVGRYQRERGRGLDYLRRQETISRYFDCGHDDSGSFSLNNICASLRDKTNALPEPVRKPLAKFIKVYGSTYESANRAAKVLARKHGLDRERTNKLGKLLAMGDMAGMAATSVAGSALGLPFLDRTVAGFVPAASGAYLLHSAAKNPMETLAAARKAVKRSLRKIKKASKFAKVAQ